jgi:hypothetical protein
MGIEEQNDIFTYYIFNMSPTLIRAYLHSETQMFSDELPYFADGSPFGNLEVKYAFILTRLIF